MRNHAFVQIFVSVASASLFVKIFMNSKNFCAEAKWTYSVHNNKCHASMPANLPTQLN